MTARITTARIAFSIAVLAKDIARVATDSQRIKEAMVVKALGFSIAAVEVPFYWAVYYHDGRGSIRARPGHKIVYFKDPDDDPRINGAARNYPKRAAEIKKLSKRQFYKFLGEGKLVAVDKVGPAGPHPFFTQGLKGLKTVTDKSGAPGIFSQHIIAEMGDRLNWHRGATIRLR